MLFTAEDLEKVLRSEKTMTRRPHKVDGYTVGKVYPARSNRWRKAEHYILVTRKFRERLGDISLEDVKKEGYNSLIEFKAGWIKKVGPWKPKRVVMAYEFKLHEKEKGVQDNGNHSQKNLQC